MDRIITLIGFGKDQAGRNFLILDGKFFAWEEGLAYIREKLGTSDEKKVDEFIFALPEEQRLWIKEGRPQSPEQWLAKIEREYRTAIQLIIV